MSHVETSPVKVKITRAWSDISPKLYAFLTGGTAVTVIVSVLHSYADVDVDPTLAGIFITAAGSLLGYLIKDSAVIDSTEVDAPHLS